MIRYWNEVRVNSNDGWYELAAVFCGNTLEDVQQMWYDEPNVNNRRLRNYLIIGLPGCGRSGILIKLLRLPGGVSLSLQPWLDVSFAHIACGFQL